MSPLIGIYASEMSANLWEPQGAYDALASVTLSAATASISFAGIPSGYKHLQIRAIAGVGNFITGRLQFNGDTGSNYARHTLLGNGGGTAQSTSATSQTFIPIAQDNGFGRSSFPYAMIWDILDYNNVNKNKTTRMLAGFDTNGTDGGEACLQSGLWMSTAAITSITFNLSSGNYPTNTQFALYGVK